MGEEEETKPKEEIPEGCKPMMISMKQMDQHGLKAGEGLRDTIPYKLFDKEEVIEDIGKVGYMNPFFDFREALKSYTGTEILIIADNEEKYGENWYCCLTVPAMERELAKMKEEEDKALAEQKRLEEIEAARLAAEEAERNVVFEDKPMIPKPYSSETSEETLEEISILTIKPSRFLLRMQISRKRKEFGSICKFSDRDADQSALCEFRQHKDPNFELKCKEHDIGLQACPSWVATWLPYSAWSDEDGLRPSIDGSQKNGKPGKAATSTVTFTEDEFLSLREIPRLTETCTQTPFFRPLNRSTQLSKEQASEELENSDLNKFLKEATPLIEAALQQNETVDVFEDEFQCLAGGELSGLGNKGDNTMKELRTFTDLDYSKSKTLASIDWHPRSRNVVAVSCTENRIFDQRVDMFGRETNAFLLIWNFADLIHPQLVLQSPHECYEFRFCPDQPHIIAGACASGQVILWDISVAQEQLRKKNGKADGENQNESATPPPVKPFEISSIDHSHRRPVSNLHWLPSNQQINSRGRISSTQNSISHQFVTCAGDGMLLFWDIRNTKKENLKTSSKSPKRDASSEYQWTPLFKVRLHKPDGAAELGLRQFSLRGFLKDEELYLKGEEEKEEIPGTLLTFTTEDGELLYADWSGSVEVVKKSEEKQSTSNDKVMWISQDHFSSNLALRRSPFFPDILLSASSISFNLWKEGKTSPIFQSSITTALSHITCAEWSPTRPAVLAVAKMDGTLDVWDFTDQSHKPTVTIPVCSSAITSMRFRNDKDSANKKNVDDGTHNENFQVLALGDENGNLHVVQVPRNLCRASTREFDLMKKFIAREIKRVDYVKERKKIRTDEKDESIMNIDQGTQEDPIEEVEEKSSEYQRLIEQEEQRYRAMLKKMLPDDIDPTTVLTSENKDDVSSELLNSDSAF